MLFENNERDLIKTVLLSCRYERLLSWKLFHEDIYHGVQNGGKFSR